ncbi:MAG: carbon-nitrogen hydrolase family protein [Holophagaceae bacterium]
MPSRRPVRAALVQAAPAYLDLPASLDRVGAFLEEASRLEADLVVFGETWLPGYPAWLDVCPGAGIWDSEPVKAVYARLRRNSLVVDGPEAARLGAEAKSRGLTLVIGVNERVARGPGMGTLYNSLLTFTPDGRLANHHRKLVPTYTEKLVWGPGDGAGLRAVDTPAGRLGGLVCWEHWMPLARHALHESGEDIHVAVWPTVKETHQLASRHYAIEGRCFVLAAGLIMPATDLAAELETPGVSGQVLRGGCAAYGPRGETLLEPVFEREGVFCVELDLDLLDRERMTLDVSGHYARADVLSLQVNASRPGTP